VRRAVLHEGVTSVGENAFNSPLCAGMTEVRLPSTLTQVDVRGFKGCAALEEIELSPSCTTFREYAFQDCTSLGRIVFPAGTAIIDCEGIFSGCSALDEIIFAGARPSIANDPFAGVTATAWVPVGSDHGGDYGGSLTWKTWCDLEGDRVVPHDLTYIEEIPATCTQDGCMAHYGCSACGKLFGDEGALMQLSAEDMTLPAPGHLPVAIPAFAPTDHECGWTEGSRCERCGETLEAPEEIPSIYGWDGSVITAYNGSDAEIVLPADATALGDEAFMNDRTVDCVTIPANIASVGERAFGGCTALNEVHIEGDATTVASGAFEGCSDALTIYSAKSSLAHAYAADNGIRWVCWPPVMDDADLTLPVGLEEIGEEAFAGTVARVVLLDENVTSIGRRAFADSETLRQIYIPAGCEEIAADAFENCAGDLMIFGVEGSEAQRFAQAHGIAFWDEAAN